MPFSYYGGKSKVIKLYPPPAYERVIEPFAGSARYALMYRDRKVWINDTYEVIYRIWKWIQQASRKDILSLPDITENSAEFNLDDHDYLSQEEKWLIGFMLGKGQSRPNRKKMSPWSIEDNNTRKTKEFHRFREDLLSIQGKISHWKITCIDYAELPNIRATWYIDPPYQKGGEHYVKKFTDFEALGEWCKSRKGEVIVCEGKGADWLPFHRLCDSSQYKGNSTIRDDPQIQQELIWYKCDKKRGLGLV